MMKAPSNQLPENPPIAAPAAHMLAIIRARAATSYSGGSAVAARNSPSAAATNKVSQIRNLSENCRLPTKPLF